VWRALLRALLPALTAVALVWMAGPATVEPALGRCYRSLPVLQERAPLWANCPMLPEHFGALSNRQVLRAQERNRRVLASLPAESVAARKQSAALAAYREQRSGALSCPVLLERFAAQIPRASTRRLAAQRCSGPRSLREMLARARHPVGPACCCRAQA
jgi:hypothetical protein